MNEIKELFAEIGRGDVSADESALVSSGVIDSMDIMALVEAIEKRHKKMLDAKFIELQNFESFSAISDMLKRAFG
ncbi:phosphopantetheine-binding protein [Campylobacter sp. 19-13652]|uniref:phosphopantetheine-binding protein n=1 Tax=Campylobacter sp. 19-13652 TaxID=2840180 RepID=UPI001C75E142|nr:phosphopantetheine-binding protein [Campylobacter sp. 19-13652]BCX79026.1 hypothetical protein LBC_04880 [Campylobacter sp. 19-13652]